jgi:hypothetical protein
MNRSVAFALNSRLKEFLVAASALSASNLITALHPLNSLTRYSTAANQQSSFTRLFFKRYSSSTKVEMSKIPSSPFGYLSNQKVLDFSQLDQLISESNEKRQKAYDLGSQIKSSLVRCRASLEQTLTEEEVQAIKNNLDTLIQTALKEHSNDNSSKDNTRQANLGNIFGDYIRLQGTCCLFYVYFSRRFYHEANTYFLSSLSTLSSNWKVDPSIIN